MARSSPAATALVYRPLELPGTEARELFAFVGAWLPPAVSVEATWGAFDGARLVGAVLLQRAGASAMLHGPVLTLVDGSAVDDALDAAARLVELALAHTEGARIATVFARPQSLERVWVRLGFIPVPEVELGSALRSVPGAGLFGWRGGSALWSAANRGARAPEGGRRRR